MHIIFSLPFFTHWLSFIIERTLRRPLYKIVFILLYEVFFYLIFSFRMWTTVSFEIWQWKREREKKRTHAQLNHLESEKKTSMWSVNFQCFTELFFFFLFSAFSLHAHILFDVLMIGRCLNNRISGHNFQCGRTANHIHRHTHARTHTICLVNYFYGVVVAFVFG